MRHFDLAIIGTGSGNSILSEEYADWQVAIIEKGIFGGTCLNVGCIPTKMFVYPANLARDVAEAGPLGVHAKLDSVDWPAVRDRIFGRIDPIAAGGATYRRGQDNVTVFTDTARFVGPRTLTVGGETISADRIVIASGSRAHIPDIPGLDAVPFHTSDTIMRLPELPARVGIVGGGFIAAEFAGVFSGFGSEVTHIHRGAALLTREDEDISQRFTQLAQQQWDVRLNTTVTQVTSLGGDACRLELSDGSTSEVDVLLVATGRVPNSDLLDLPATGVEVTRAGTIVVDEYQRTSAEGVWALGDIAGPWQLKHVANAEARVISHNLRHPDDLVATDHRFVPAAVFTYPQIASVGLTSQQAREEGRAVVTKVQQYADVAYGWAMEAPPEWVVKLIADAGTGELVGAHILGPEASVLIQPLLQAMSLGTPTRDLARGQYWIHPALTEVVENALLGLPSN